MEYIKKSETLPSPFNILQIPKSIKEHVYKPILRLIRRDKNGKESYRSNSTNNDLSAEAHARKGNHDAELNYKVRDVS
jgi:hypothetical protein